MHLHLRQDDMLKIVAPLSAASFAGAVIMPNLLPPVDSAERLANYRRAIDAAVGDLTFEPYMTLFFRDYSEGELLTLREHIIGIKLYPAGVTTNSDAGVAALEAAESTIGRMEDLGIPLLVHGETNDFVMDREEAFLSVYDRLAQRFPRLQITMEHITTRRAVELLERHDNLRATVTLHHLLITLDDLAGGLLNPHLFCKPIAKRPEDRQALLEAALAAHPRLMFGSDSAPHPLSSKECSGCAAGVFTAPIALPMLAELFERHGALDKLQDFVSGNAQRLYGITPPPKVVRLHKEEFHIPAAYGPVVPMNAGGTVTWCLS